ncbi:MAG: class B sortase [Oscillospiraceae bacterium]
MKILGSIIALLLVAVIGIAGVTLYKGTVAPPPPSSSAPAPSMAKVEPKKPQTPFEVPEALAKAIERNKDTVAWLEVGGTDINNSVLQAKDNDFYLRRNEAKEDEIYGCYFADYECAIGARDVLKPNTVIYGHSSPGDDPNGKRFSQLFRYLDAEVAKANPYIRLCTQDERLVFEIFAIFYTDINFDYIKVNIEDEEMQQIAAKAKELSIYDYGKSPEAGDKFITLSTCTEKFGTDGTHRFVIMGRLLPKDAEILPSVEIAVK